MGRGLSEMQHAILEKARLRGYITPAEAMEESWTNITFCSSRAIPKVRSTASRALRRLCIRGLLWHDKSERWHATHTRQIFGWDVYRVVGWYGCMQFMDSEQIRNGDKAKEWEVPVPMPPIPPMD